MSRCLCACRRFALVALLAACGNAMATFHLFVVDQVFSNADATVQYVVFLQSPPSADEEAWGGHKLESTHDGDTQTLTYHGNLPSRLTRNKRVLVATQAFANLNLVKPDFIMPAGFLGTTGGRLVCCDDGVNYAYSSLPLDGKNAIDGTKAVTPAVATNFAGESAAVNVASTPPPPPPAAFDPNQHGLDRIVV